MEFGEMVVIKSIHKALECAQKEYKEHKDGDVHVKYMVKAFHMLIHYFNEKGIDPNQHQG